MKEKLSSKYSVHGIENYIMYYVIIFYKEFHALSFENSRRVVNRTPKKYFRRVTRSAMPNF